MKHVKMTSKMAVKPVVAETDGKIGMDKPTCPCKDTQS